jgi:hypothetical protein
MINIEGKIPVINVLIKGAFLCENKFNIIKMHGTTIKKNTLNVLVSLGQ